MMKTMDIDALDRECAALGSLFQQVVVDMKASVPLYEDFLGKANKLHIQLRSTVSVLASFFEAFQRIADAANSARGATREIGTGLTRMAIRHRSVETRIKAVACLLHDCLIATLQDKMDEWRKVTSILDKDHTKENKRMRTEVRKRHEMYTRAHKKHQASLGSGGGSANVVANNSVAEAEYRLFEQYRLFVNSERMLVRRALAEERGRFQLLSASLVPLVNEQLALAEDLNHLGPIQEAIVEHTSVSEADLNSGLALHRGPELGHDGLENVVSLPTSSEQIIVDISRKCNGLELANVAELSDLHMRRTIDSPTYQVTGSPCTPPAGNECSPSQPNDDVVSSVSSHRSFASLSSARESAQKQQQQQQQRQRNFVRDDGSISTNGKTPSRSQPSRPRSQSMQYDVCSLSSRSSLADDRISDLYAQSGCLSDQISVAASSGIECGASAGGIYDKRRQNVAGPMMVHQIHSARSVPHSQQPAMRHQVQLGGNSHNIGSVCSMPIGTNGNGPNPGSAYRQQGRLASMSSRDSGFTSQDTLFSRPQSSNTDGQSTLYGKFLDNRSVVTSPPFANPDEMPPPPPPPSDFNSHQHVINEEEEEEFDEVQSQVSSFSPTAEIGNVHASQTADHCSAYTGMSTLRRNNSVAAPSGYHRRQQLLSASFRVKPAPPQRRTCTSLSSADPPLPPPHPPVMAGRPLPPIVAKSVQMHARQSSDTCAIEDLPPPPPEMLASPNESDDFIDLPDSASCVRGQSRSIADDDNDPIYVPVARLQQRERSDHLQPPTGAAASAADRVRAWLECRVVTDVISCRPSLNAEIARGIDLKSVSTVEVPRQRQMLHHTHHR